MPKYDLGHELKPWGVSYGTYHGFDTQYYATEEEAKERAAECAEKCVEVTVFRIAEIYLVSVDHPKPEVNYELVKPEPRCDVYRYTWAEPKRDKLGRFVKGN